MLIPDVMAESVRLALIDMGADLTAGRDTIFQGLFNDQLVVCYQRGAFAEIVCKHQLTYQHILQIVSMLVKK